MVGLTGNRVRDYNDRVINIPKRNEIQPGLRVWIIQKHHQASGQLTEGIVARILTSSPSHPHGIKVLLVSGQVGRVQSIVH